MRCWLAGLAAGLLLASAAPGLAPGAAFALAVVLFGCALLPVLVEHGACLFAGVDQEI